jgi:LmbE family N-acetylglucosaminyl deacetylase
MTFYNLVIRHICTEIPKDNLKKSAVVFSPHFDDETLGCGGTILKKKRVGADVKIVFMTDGSKSHSHLIAEDKLKAIRKSESLIVCRSLGLTENDVFFLDFEETKLNEHNSSAVNKVIEILLTHQPDEVFIPYRRDPTFWSLDHLSTTRIVMSALQDNTSGLQENVKKASVYEYPIWMWYHQAFISALMSGPNFFGSMKNRLVSGLNLLKDFRSSVYIGDVLQLKRAALNHYTSQMTRLIPDSNWPTLGDLSNGKFLECFFQEYEIFSLPHLQ